MFVVKPSSNIFHPTMDETPNPVELQIIYKIDQVHFSIIGHWPVLANIIVMQPLLNKEFCWKFDNL